MHVQEQGKSHRHMSMPQSQERNGNTGDGHACDPLCDGHACDPLSKSLPLSVLFSRGLIHCPLVCQWS